MDIFVIDINTIDFGKWDSFINKNDKKVFYKNELKQKQHYAGLYLFRYVAKNFYGINEPELEFKNNKPFIKNSDLYLSISHSKNIAVVAFDKGLVGIDIEYNKQKRNFLKVAKRCFSEENYQKLEELPKPERQKYFYELWTRYEAEIKLGCQKQRKYYLTDYFVDEFTFSAVGENTLSIDTIEFIKN